MPELELGKVQIVPTKRLRLDPCNPRRAGRTKDSADLKIIAWLYRSAALDELLLSISSNGYMDIEPLVVVREDTHDGLLVLEGNRRLAAMRLFLEPGLAADIKESESLDIRIPKIDQSLLPTLEKTSVHCVRNRESARSFIGFKHINGPAKWDAYAKARFVTDWHKQFNFQDIELIARMIGDGHSTIRLMVSAMYVLDQACKNDLFDIEYCYYHRFNFSNFYAALYRPQYLDYLGISSDWHRHDPRPDTVDPQQFSRLKKLLMWIYGSRKDNQSPVVRFRNPDIKRLGEVLSHPESLHVLETTSDLDRAHALTESIDSRFIRSLFRAREEIRGAFHSIGAFDGLDSSLVDVAGDVHAVSETVHQRMLEKSFEARFKRAGL